jgi:hypothetical protein
MEALSEMLTTYVIYFLDFNLNFGLLSGLQPAKEKFEQKHRLHIPEPCRIGRYL